MYVLCIDVVIMHAVSPLGMYAGISFVFVTHDPHSNKMDDMFMVCIGVLNTISTHFCALASNVSMVLLLF